MEGRANDQIVFVSSASTVFGWNCLRLLIDSFRKFGGDIGQSQFWIFNPQPDEQLFAQIVQQGVQIHPLTIPEPISHYPFAGKVASLAKAESMATGKVGSLVWMDPICLVVNPPVLYDLGQSYDAAVRPVHIQNIGLAVNDPIDAYWQGIYKMVGVQDIEMTVRSFVDQRTLRAYFNSHALAVNPSLGLMQCWLEGFQFLVSDRNYQNSACQDERHQVFLFQALLSALLAVSLDPQRIRLLPPTYNYPYNLQHAIPTEQRGKVMNDLVSLTYEEKSVDPASVNDIQIKAPLYSWLREHA